MKKKISISKLELNDKNWNKKLTLLSNYRQQLAISLTNQPKSGKIKTEKDVLSKYGMFKTDEFISESIAEYADKKDKSRPVAKKTIKILMMGEDNMLMSLPDEMYEYVDITGKDILIGAKAKFDVNPIFVDSNIRREYISGE